MPQHGRTVLPWSFYKKRNTAQRFVFSPDKTKLFTCLTPAEIRAMLVRCIEHLGLRLFALSFAGGLQTHNFYSLQSLASAPMCLLIALTPLMTWAHKSSAWLWKQTEPQKNIHFLTHSILCTPHMCFHGPLLGDQDELWPLTSVWKVLHFNIDFLFTF